MGVPCPAAAGVLPGEAPGSCREPKSPALVRASDVPPVPGNPSLDSFTLPRWERTYLGVFRPLTRRSPPARDGGTLPPCAPGARGVPTGCRFPDPSRAPLAVSPPVAASAHFTAGQGEARHPRVPGAGWMGGSRVGAAPWDPLERLLGWGLLPPTPVLHLAASPSFQRSRPRLAASGDPEGGKAGWGGKVFKSTKKEKKSPPP